MCDRTDPSLQPLQLQVRPPVLHAVCAALLMLGEVAEPPKAWRSLGPRLGKKDAQGNRLPWRGRLLRRLAAFDPLGMSEARVERVQAPHLAWLYLLWQSACRRGSTRYAACSPVRTACSPVRTTCNPMCRRTSTGCRT